jgi:hypothetical protein
MAGTTGYGVPAYAVPAAMEADAAIAAPVTAPAERRLDEVFSVPWVKGVMAPNWDRHKAAIAADSKPNISGPYCSIKPST